MESHQIVELVEAFLMVLGIGVVVYSPIARAIGNRIMHGKTLAPGAAAPDDQHRVEDLSGEVAALRQAMYEQQERLDFTERVIAQARAKEALPGPK
jgi:hypothetical protein